MLKNILLGSIALCGLLIGFANEVKAQHQPRFEIGAHVTSLFVTEKSDHDTGLGVRFTYNLKDYLGLKLNGTRCHKPAKVVATMRRKDSLAPVPASIASVSACLPRRVRASRLFICWESILV